MGHKPDSQYHDLWEEYMDGDIDYESFMDEYRNPNNYQPQSVYSNRARTTDIIK
jgi:hypothetical protein